MIVHLLLQGTKLLTLFKTKLLSNCSALENDDYLDRKMAKGAKIFNDPVHGHIEMPELCVRIIDTPQFQRLRNIKQLGGCYFVYPGASHNRFEHSIGTAHLAGCLVERLQTNQPDLKISKEDVLCVKIAGLCHDLGHGPFSHLFDGSFIPKALGEKKKPHEEASLKMFDLIYQSLKKEFENHELDDTDATFIKELINGPLKQNEAEGSSKEWPYKGRDKEKGFLYEIISNKESGIDVDKWDYFSRDCHHLGMKSSFDHMRCIKMARVIEVKQDGKRHICFRDKEAQNLYEMFHLRSNLHRRAYQHKTSNAIAHMITDALLEADPHIRLEGKEGKDGKKTEVKMSQAIDDMVAYTKLTDQVYYQILHSSDKDLEKAKAILERIESRDLYRLVGEHTAKKDISCKDAEKTKILEKAKDSVEKDDIILDKTKFDYGRKEKDPVKKVYFYKKTDQDNAFQLGDQDEFSYMLPANFVEWKIRLYLRKELEKEKKDQLKKGFDEWFKEKEKVSVQGGSSSTGAADDDAGGVVVTPEKDTPIASPDEVKAQKKLVFDEEKH